VEKYSDRCVVVEHLYALQQEHAWAAAASVCCSGLASADAQPEQ
jgi:hypothetical protein